MRNWRLRVRTILCCLIANLSAVSISYSAPVVFDQDTTISATDISHEGQDIIVNGALLTIDGSHQFNSVQLINNAVLSHSVSPASPLIITINTFFIDGSSQINLMAKGYLPTATVTGASGGSYGGLGGVYLGTTNAVFGSEQQPTDFGIGGIGSGGETHGGGAIRIIADSLILDGQIIADGEDFITFFYSQGGGSGGSIRLDIGTLSGAGTLQANGGSGFTFQGGGGGGGGRIAVYYNSATFDLQNNIINLGGVCKPFYGQPGQPGTIYLDNISENLPPVADAGISLFANEQTEVILRGNATDPDGVVSSYSWTQLSSPAVNLIDANTATPSFISPTVLVANSPTVLRFLLTVTDDDGATDTSETSVGVLAVNALPTANASDDINTNEVTSVILSGSGNDSDGNITTYQWIQTSGSPVTLNTNAATASFLTPRLKTSETLSFRLTVTDNETGTGSDEVLVTVNPINTPPVAVIIPLGPVAENTTVMLDGSTSSDPDIDGFIISYNWTQIDGPVVNLSNTTNAVAYFTAPAVYQDTTLSFHLDILDDEGGVATATTHVTIYSTNPDDDADNMLDLWELDFFGTLEHDGTEDTDNDGATDLQEHGLGTDPTVEQQPGQPEIISPDDIEVSSLQPLLTLTNPDQHPDFSIVYQYEVYADTAMSDLVITTSGAGLSWSVSVALSDNTRYYWRARAVGTTLYSEWVSSKFFVNTANDAPGNFNVSYPLDGVWVSSFTPTLSITNSVDVDEDALSYSFEIFVDSDLTQSPVASIEGILPDESGTTSWNVDVPLLENNWYSWRTIVTDEHGLSTVSNSTPMIFVNTMNDAPTAPTLHSPADNSEITTLYAELVVNNASDPESEAIHYLFEIDTVNTFDSSNKQSSDLVTETPNLSSWYVNELIDNSWYYWRAKASDGLAESLWVNGSFFVNQFNDAPGTPNALNPGDNAWVGSLQPTLQVYPAVDIDGDALSYEFKVYKANKHSNDYDLIVTGNSNTTNWQLDILLDETGNYYWHARAVDEHGLAGEWGDLTMFFADSDGINDAPTIKLKYLKYEHGDVFALHKYKNQHCDNNEHNNNGHHNDSERDNNGHHNDNEHDNNGHRNDSERDDNGHHNDNEDDEASFVEIRWKDRDPDSNAHISLYFDTDRQDEDGVLITQGILEDPDGLSDRFLWDTTQMTPGIYFVYAIIDDGNTTSTAYSNNAIIVGNGGGLPFLIFNSPSVENEGTRNQRANIQWSDLDNNSNASISFYYDTDKAGFDGTLIVDAIEEDPDGRADKYLWDVSTLPEGKYFIYAIISDETNNYRVYANEAFSIRHHGHHRH